ncbi:MAG: DUF2264 domain-containing protein [Dysgonamonadaceae bacterium]|nr:DUF2264 domain-containing protein [Dysgonamonadaceae bacterium]
MKSRYLFLMLAYFCSLAAFAQNSGAEDRRFWVETMCRIADPVLTSLSDNSLKKNMPYESIGSRKEFSYLEAVGRVVCGIAPWLELGSDDSWEGKLRKKYITLTISGLKNATDPASPDYLVFDQPSQPLVDAAFLAQGLLRAKTQLWNGMDDNTKNNVIAALQKTRIIRPFESNWLLFASIIEAALLEFTGECDKTRMMDGVLKFRDQWYEGDANYGDGAAFHADYYNSYVIHPMLTDVLMVMDKHGMDDGAFLATQRKRLTRYAEQQERLISPEGTYPIIGRSITYRFGAFHALAQACLMHLLPQSVEPAQVRCALTAVIRRQLESPDNFDAKGWLRVGFTGSQIEMSEPYINTGSVYLCTMGLLPLGLPESDEFWSAPYAEWTNKKGWGGKNVKADKAI